MWLENLFQRLKNMKSFKMLTAFNVCTLNMEYSLDLRKGKDLTHVIFNSSWDKGGIMANAGKVATDKHLVGGRGSGGH